MAALNWSSQGVLRSPTSLRSLFVWLLLTLLLAGAASYTHGTRYAIVPGCFPIQAIHDPGPAEVPPQAKPAVSVSGTEESGKDCCQNRHAPRGEPTPRTGFGDSPSVAHQYPGDALINNTAPPKPDLPALTVVELSISRT